MAAHSDLFHTNVPEDWIVEIFAIMARTPRHTYQILTKRPRRMQSLLARVEFWSAVEDRVRKRLSDIPPFRAAAARVRDCLPNVWVGASIERQEVERERTDALLSTPAAVRFLSLEPLLGDLDISAALPRGCSAPECPCETDTDCADRGVDWVIAGGESGPGARPMDPQWVRNIRDQCILAAVPFFFKQWGSWGPTVVRGETRMRRMSKLRAGRVLDGRTWDEMPAWTR